MKRPLLVHIERLREGKTESFEEQLDPALLQMADEELACNEPITVSGEVYLVDTWLIVKLSFTANIVIPCSFCNEPFILPIRSDLQHEESLEEISGGVFDLLPVVREAILLEIPFYPQCGGETCRNRDKIEKFLKKPNEESATETYHPFEDL